MPDEPQQTTDPEQEDTEEREPNLAEQRQQAFDEARARLKEVRAKEPEDRAEDELHEANFQAQVRWLQLKWGDGGDAPACPYCGNETWNVEQPLGLAVVEDDRPLPLFPVICENCGQATFVSTYFAGLGPEEDDESNAEQ